MRKVYSLLSIQLAITTIIGAALLLTPGVKEMVQVELFIRMGEWGWCDNTFSGGSNRTGLT